MYTYSVMPVVNTINEYYDDDYIIHITYSMIVSVQ